MIVPGSANANKQFAAAHQSRNQFVIVISGVRPQLAPVFRATGGTGIVLGQTHERRDEGQAGGGQAGRNRSEHRFSFSLLMDGQEHKKRKGDAE
jgi:hypothetical protein